MVDPMTQYTLTLTGADRSALQQLLKIAIEAPALDLNGKAAAMGFVQRIGEAPELDATPIAAVAE